MYALIALAIVFVWPAASSVLLVAGAVYVALQALKSYAPLQPYIQGWLAFALNVVLSVLGTIVAVPADQLYSLSTLEMLLVAIFGAAGIHDTVKALLLKPASGSTQKLGALMLCAVLLMGTLPVCGCSVSVKQVAADAETVATAALQIGTALESSYGTLAAQIVTAANDVSTVAKALASGTSTESKLTSVLSALYTILAAVPQTTAIAQFLPIAIAGIEALWTIIAGNSTTVSAAPLKAWSNPYHGLAKIHHRIGRSMEGDFGAAWNDAVRAYPGAGMSRI